jgi:EpsI family protein
MTQRLFVLASIFVVASVMIGRATKSEPVPVRTSFATFPSEIAGWRGMPGEPFDKKVLDVLGVDEYVNLVYAQRAQIPLGLYIGYYQSQREGDTMHSPLNCLPGAGWAPESKSFISVPVARSSEAGAPTDTISINRYVIRKGVDRQLVLYWYQSHGRVVASEYSSKVYMVLDALRTNRTDAALVRIVTPIADAPGSEEDAERRAVGFVQAMVPLLHRYLPS